MMFLERFPQIPLGIRETTYSVHLGHPRDFTFVCTPRLVKILHKQQGRMAHGMNRLLRNIEGVPRALSHHLTGAFVFSRRGQQLWYLRHRCMSRPCSNLMGWFDTHYDAWLSSRMAPSLIDSDSDLPRRISIHNVFKFWTYSQPKCLFPH